MGDNERGNKLKTAVVLFAVVVHDTRHASAHLSAEQATRIIGVLVLLLLCPAIHWRTPWASPRADGIG